MQNFKTLFFNVLWFVRFRTTVVASNDMEYFGSQEGDSYIDESKHKILMRSEAVKT
jgi:hypothetical protein